MIIATDIACGFCGARKGKPCRTRHGRPMRRAHMARVNEAQHRNTVAAIAAAAEEDRAERRAEERRFAPPLEFKVLTLSHVWCDNHGALHEWTRDPYDYGHPDCDPIDWRRVYIETADESETF